MKTFILIVCAVAICFGAFAASTAHTGVWTAELQDEKLQFTIFRSDRDQHDSWHNHGGDHFYGGERFSLDVTLGELAGVTRSDVIAEASNVKFELVREAGTLSFDGRFAGGSGAGHFNFKPSEAFVRNLESMGLSDFKEEQLLVFAAHNLTTNTVRGLQSLGYRPSNNELVEIAVFGITPEIVRDYAKLGYPRLTLHELVEMRIGHVDAGYVQGMRDLGFTGLSAHQIAETGILGVTPAWVRELHGAGVEATSLRELTDLRVGHVTAKRIDEYRKAGYPNLTARELSELGIQSVTPAYIEEMRKAGYDHLTVKQLVNAKIFAVTPEFIRKMTAAGYTAVPLEKLVQLKMAGAADLVTRRK